MRPTRLANAIRGRLPALVALSLLASGAAGAGATEKATVFLPGFPDVPLMQGLDVDEGGTVVFDKPDGRILEASAAGPVAASDLVSYYVAALPALGWREGGARPHRLQFRREGELLQIEFAPRGSFLAVRFFLAPS